jgi:transcriptional regulator GlxA family with amidase domain
VHTRKLIRYQEIVSHAEKVARTQIDEPLHISDICKAGTVSPRTLRNAFLTVCGMTPYRYLRALRMAEARQALLSPIAATLTVTEVAMQFGFFELGRFSVEYRTAFGECPSETLRRRNSSTRHHTSAGNMTLIQSSM